VSDTPDIEAVFWDIGGVILAMESVREGHQQFVQSLVERHGSPLSPEAALGQWRTTLGEYFEAREGTTYRPAREGYRRAVDAILAADADSVDWKALFDRIHVGAARANPGARETIGRLAESDVHLGVVSDVDEDEGRRILAALEVLDQFDAVTTSEAVGRTKPDPAMFETALQAAGVPAGRAAMIGDRYTHDMQGGRDAGLVTVAYGAEDGPAVDYRAETLREIPGLLGIDG